MKAIGFFMLFLLVACGAGGTGILPGAGGAGPVGGISQGATGDDVSSDDGATDSTVNSSSDFATRSNTTANAPTVLAPNLPAPSFDFGDNAKLFVQIENEAQVISSRVGGTIYSGHVKVSKKVGGVDVLASCCDTAWLVLVETKTNTCFSTQIGVDGAFSARLNGVADPLIGLVAHIFEPGKIPPGAPQSTCPDPSEFALSFEAGVDFRVVATRSTVIEGPLHFTPTLNHPLLLNGLPRSEDDGDE